MHGLIIDYEIANIIRYGLMKQELKRKKTEFKVEKGWLSITLSR